MPSPRFVDPQDDLTPRQREMRFWQREGFGELYRKATPQFTGDAIVMQRSF